MDKTRRRAPAPEGGVNQREPRNEAESAFFVAAKARGWTVTKRGWPDFFCFNEEEGKVAVVEVKPTSARPLKYEQELLMRTLARHGIACFKWSPDGGFERIGGGE